MLQHLHAQPLCAAQPRCVGWAACAGSSKQGAAMCTCAARQPDERTCCSSSDMCSCFLRRERRADSLLESILRAGGQRGQQQ
jgi:hypothetical protein